MPGRFRDRLHRELLRRREKNVRYSLRAFAAFLGADHSTLSQVLRGYRRVPAGRIRVWAKRIGLGAEETAAYIVAEQLPDAQQTERESRLLQWSAEAMAIMTEPVHWRILLLSRTPGFRADCRWVSEQIGFTVDEVNIALSRLLRLGLLETSSTGCWVDCTKPPVETEREFHDLALVRVREKAAEF